MKIPFVDLKAQYQSIRSEIDGAIQSVIDDGAFIGGFSNKYVQSFEKNFSHFLNGAGFVGCANGTDSLEIILQAHGISVNDEVLVPALSWISSAECISNIGARPVFVDVKPECFTIDETKIIDKITSNTKAIIPVHLYGHPCEMDMIMKIAEEHNLLVIEDCAQSHGALYKGRLTGTMGDASSFSFYPGKNLGAYGDAGGISIRDSLILEKARQIANHGQTQKHNHVSTGRNSRLDGIQASILDVKLPYLQEWNKKRRVIAETYMQRLSHLPIVLPKSSAQIEHVYHLFVIRIKNRDQIIKKLEAKGVSTSIHYPIALPAMPAFQYLGINSNDYPVAIKGSSEILSLPIYPEMGNAQVNYVCDCIDESLS
jgi:dTDP-4-amino-4,6-dideoxygalactose transaminase